jgi:glycerol kinase
MWTARGRRPRRGELLFGTVDSYLIWRLTGGAAHVTDATNAARTLLYDIREGRWDDEILKLLNIPDSLLPEVLDCGADFGTSDPALVRRAIPILGVAGDQQAATLGQACFTPGMLKSTYGTGCFALLNTGDTLVESRTGCSAPSPTSSTANRPTRWRARSSSPAPWCNGCATG